MSAAAGSAPAAAASAVPAVPDNLKSLCSGHIFDLYSPAAHLPGGFSKSQIFLFYRPAANGGVGKIYVAGASGDLASLTAIATTMTEEQLITARLPTVDAARLSAVTLDKATAELKAAGDAVSADTCFQFGTPEMSLSLSADSKQTRDLWTQGLVSLMTEAQKTVAPPLSPTSAATAAAAVAARRFSFDVKDQKLAETLPQLAAETLNRLANNDAQLLSIPALDFVSMMLVGRNFGFYADVGGKATRFPVFLFYKFEQGTPGFLYWCNPGTRAESVQTCLPLSKIDRLYIGKQVAVFTPEAKEECCFTLLTPEAMVNLEAGSASQASAWLYAIDAALRGYSQRRFHHTEADPKAARYYVDGVNAPNKFLQLDAVVMTSTANAAMGQQVAEIQAHVADPKVDPKAASQEIAAERTAAAIAMSANVVAPQPGIAMEHKFAGTGPNPETYQMVIALKAGNNFVSHLPNGTTDTISVHYTPDETKAGSLSCVSLAHPNDAPKRIPLQNISDLVTGKDAPVWALPNAAHAQPSSCLAITYRISADATAVLYLEGRNAQIIDFWVKGIHAVIHHAMHRNLNGGYDGAAKPPAGLSALKVSDVKLDFGAIGGDSSSHEPSTSPRANLPLGSDTDLMLPTDVLVKMISKGRTFTRWTAAGGEQVTVTYKKDETKSGSFYFSTADSARFPLHAITEVSLGKSNANFSAAAAANSPDEHCFTFSAGADSALSLEAEGKEVVGGWLSAFTSIMHLTGKDVVLNDAESSTAPVPLSDEKIADARSFAVTLSADNLLATAPASLSESDSIGLLTRGFRFTKYEKSEGESIFVTFHRDVTRSGSLYWCALGDNPHTSRSIERALPLHTLTDIYFGKQTMQFTSFAASREADELCLSLVTRDNRSLNVSASNPEQLSAFLLALQTVLAQSGKKITVGDEKFARTKHTRRFTIHTAKPSLADRAAQAGAQALGRSRKQSVLSVPLEDLGAADYKQPAQQELDSALGKGIAFRRLDEATGTVTPNVLFFFSKDETKQGSLYWSDDGTRPVAPDPSKRAPLESLKDVVLGSVGNAAMTTAGFDDKRSATLVFATANIHIESANPEALSNFLLGVHGALTSTGSQVVTEDVGRVRKFSVLSADGEGKATAADTKAIEAGATVTAFTSRGGAAKHAKVRVWFANPEAGYGRVFWSDGNSNASERYSLSVADITELAIGKNKSKALQDAGQPFNDDTCFTIVTPTKTLSVGTDSSAVVKEWTATLQQLIVAQSSIVTAASNHIEDSNHGLSMFGGTPSSPAAKDALQVIHVGHDFKAYKIKGGKVGHINMFLFYEPSTQAQQQQDGLGVSFGELYWSAPGTRNPKPKHHIKLSTVTDLFIGKHADMEVFRTAEVSDDCVFTIVGTEQTLSIEASSKDVAQHWISALTYILQRHGRDVLVQDEDGKTLAPNATPARRRVSFLPYEVSAPGPGPTVSAAEVGVLFAAGRGGEVMSNATANEVVQMMRYGRKFTAFLENHARTLLLFFAPSPVEHREGPGRLYWSHPSHRAESPLNSLLLTAIQDYSLGKQAKAFQISEGKGADDKCCFSLTTKYGVFCFEAASPAMRDSWIAGINYLLVSAGNKRLQLVDRSAAGGASGDEKAAPAGAGGDANIRYCFVDDVNLEALSTSTFDLARQMVRDPKALQSHNDAALRLMREGHEFFAFFFAKDRSLVKHKIFVFFRPSIDPNDGTFGLGTLFWNETHSYNENPVRKLFVHDITDIYVGKQSSPFRHPSAVDVPDTACFSLVSATKTLNLQAVSATILNVWLVGLSALMNGGKKEVSLRENDRNAAAASAAAQASTQAGSWTSSAGSVGPRPDGVLAKLHHMKQNYTQAHNDQVLQWIANGTAFVKFTADGSAPTKQVVKLFYQPPSQAGGPLSEGALYWTTDLDRKVLDRNRSIVCSQLREIQLLKSSAGFKLAEAAEAPADRCLTLKAADGSAWYLCAATTDELNVWLYGLIELIAHNEQTIRILEDGERTPEAAAQAPVLSNQTVIDAATKAAVYDMMARGSKFFSYDNGLKAGEIRKKQVFVYTETDKATGVKALLWKSAGATGRIELADITNIYIGKRHRILVSLRALDNNRCMTIVTATQILNLEGDSKKQIIAWVFGLYCAMAGAGRQINGRSSTGETAGVTATAAELARQGATPQPLRNAALQQAGLDPARTLLAELESDGSVESTVRTLAGAAASRTAASEFAVRSLIRGRVFTAYSAVGHPRRESVFVTYEPSAALNGAGSLRWVAGDKASEAGVQTLPLDKVSDIHLGKQNAAFRTAEASEADPERCLSVLSDDLKIALHLEAASVEAAKAFLVAINTAIAVGGRDVVLLGASGASSTDRRFGVMTRATQPTRGGAAPAATNRQLLAAPLLADTVAVLAKGAAFTAHSAHAPQTSQVFVFYKSDAYSSRAGALYWCEVGKRSESNERRLPIESITNIVLGKATGAFQTAAASAVKDELAFSVLAGHRALHLSAASADVVQCWFVAINGLLSSIGKAVNEDGDGSSTNKFVVVNDVATAGSGGAAATELINESEDDYGVELDASLLNSISPVIVWEGFLKARAAADKAAAPLFFRADTQSLSYFADSSSEAKALGVVQLSTVLRVRSKGTEIVVLISGKSDDRVLRLNAADVATASALANSLNDLIKHQRAPSRLDLADVNSSVLLFAPSDSKADAEAGGADEKFPVSAAPTATVNVTVQTVSLSSAVKAGSVLSFRVNAGGVSVSSSKSITVDEDGLVARQRINFGESVSLAVPLYDERNKTRNLLLDVTVSNGDVVVGHWTNGQSEEVADWNLLPHPQVVASFWQSLETGYRAESPLLSFDASATSVGTIVLSAAVSKSAASARALNAGDEKYPVSVSAAAADESDEIVLALSPEETMQMLADRPAGTLTAEERADAVRVVTTGQQFTRYSVDPASKQTVKEEVFVFYNASVGASGSFFWCPAGQRVQSYKKRLPLSAITSVSLGKNSPALKTAVADRTVTLSSPKFSLSIEAKSAHQLTAFLCSIHAIKTAAGKRVVASN